MDAVAAGDPLAADLVKRAREKRARRRMGTLEERLAFRDAGQLEFLGGKAEMSKNEAGIELDGAAIAFHRFLEVLEVGEHIAEIGLPRGAVGFELCCAAER